MSENIFGTHDEKTLAQLTDVASRAERVALMADGHLGYVMPNRHELLALIPEGLSKQGFKRIADFFAGRVAEW